MVFTGDAALLIETWVPAEVDPLLELQAEIRTAGTRSMAYLMDFKIIGKSDRKYGGFFMLAIQLINCRELDDSV